MSIGVHRFECAPRAGLPTGRRMTRSPGMRWTVWEARCSSENNPRPTAKFGVGLRTIVAGASARRKQPGSEGVANRHFVGGNAGSAKASPSTVRNPDVGIRGRIIVGPHLRQSPGVNTSPVTDFPMRFYAVVWRPTVGVEFPGLESSNDDLLLDGNSGVHQTAVCPYGKTIGKGSGFHLAGCCCCQAFTRWTQAGISSRS